MKAAASTLNPFAESYIPLALREARSDNADSAISNDHGTKKFPVGDDLKLKGQEADDDSQGAPSQMSQIPDQIASNMKFGDENFEMDLAYLQMLFPGMSDQSVMDVYTFNNGDLEASMEMLSQLESGESPDALPDALDIGDIPEAVSSGECSSVKVKNVVGESSSSSSGSSNLAIAS